MEFYDSTKKEVRVSLKIDDYYNTLHLFPTDCMFLLSSSEHLASSLQSIMKSQNK